MLAGIGISPFGPTLYFGVTHVGKIAENLNLCRWGRNMAHSVYMRLTCSIRITVYYYLDNANDLSAPSESYFA